MVISNTRYWLDEEDLKTPEHDDLVFFVMDNALDILEELKIIPELDVEFHLLDEYKDLDKTQEIIQEKQSVMKAVESLKKRDLIKIDKIESEVKIGDKYHSGYIDVKVTLKLGVPIKSKFFDITCFLEKPLVYYFEIKPQVQSFGNVLRQFNYYRDLEDGFTKLKCANFILVTKTKGMKERFESQWINVYEFDEKKRELR